MASAAPKHSRALDVAVVGGGHGSYAAAADLAEAGHRVRLWRRDAAALAPVLESGSLVLLDHAGEREVELELVSADLGEAVAGAELILVPLPATAQASVAAALAPHLEAGQVVFAPPGTLGSFLMASVVEATRPGLEVAWAEAGTLPYLARKRGERTVAVSARATRLPSGVFPALLTPQALPVLTAAYPAVEPLVDALDAALTNAGPVIHPPLIVLNAAAIEHFDSWDIHNEGTQPSVRAVQDALDAERIAVREALGYPAPHYPLRDHYQPDGEEWMYGNAAHEQLVASADWHEPLDLIEHRYVREDILLGLALLVSCGRQVELPMPVSAGLLALASTFAGAQPGRTLTGLGLGEKTPAQLRELFLEGLA